MSIESELARILSAMKPREKSRVRLTADERIAWLATEAALTIIRANHRRAAEVLADQSSQRHKEEWGKFLTALGKDPTKSHAIEDLYGDSAEFDLIEHDEH